MYRSSQLVTGHQDESLGTRIWFQICVGIAKAFLFPSAWSAFWLFMHMSEQNVDRHQPL